MASKLPRIVPTCHEGRFGPWFELDWTGRPNQSMATRHVVLVERKLTTYVYAISTPILAWLALATFDDPPLPRSQLALAASGHVPPPLSLGDLWRCHPQPNRP
ncbi:hypothetical protein TIFTF001_027447 [Ficus carica]|uniref:Uncharacterized protein n=1 Tax=Ficus carica TaxID=3494 RepID=A0AA88DN31_FICCA|nr:hypothetical protein TIFTF001_027447 [Ficus carica]